MIKSSKAFSSFAVNDIPKARQFYEKVLGLEVADASEGTLNLKISGGAQVLISPLGPAHAGELHRAELPGPRDSRPR